MGGAQVIDHTCSTPLPSPWEPPPQLSKAARPRDQVPRLWAGNQAELEGTVFLISQLSADLFGEDGGFDELHISIYAKGVQTSMAYYGVAKGYTRVSSTGPSTGC